MVTQRCALTVQLQPFMTHIPGLLASTMHIRNVRYHRNTEHTIARSHLISPSKALNTLRLALISTIPDRAVRSSPADQRWFLASFITIRSLTLQNSTFARSDSRMNLSIHWFWRHCACKYHPLVFFIRLEFPPPIDFASGRKERFISFLYRSVTINIPRCMKGNWQAIVLERPVSLDTRAVGSLSKKMRKKEEVIGQLRIQLTRSWRRLLLNCCGRWHTRSVSAPHHRSMKLNSLCHSLSPSLTARSPSSAFGKINVRARLVIKFEKTGRCLLRNRIRYVHQKSQHRILRERSSIFGCVNQHHRAHLQRRPWPTSDPRATSMTHRLSRMLIA